MKLHIHSRNTQDREELRTLLIDTLGDLLGDGHHVLEAKLPWDGHPILAADAAAHPVLISFEPDNSQAALINGLAGVEQLSAALPWINQVYDVLGNRQLPPRLIIISSDAPPGSGAILTECPNLLLYTYKVLRVNSDTGVWLERIENKAGVPGTQAPGAPVNRTGARPTLAKAVSLPELSEEENNYFQQL
jgi:hypothetical protein